MTKPIAVWTEPENQIIRRHYRTASNQEIRDLLPGKTLQQIQTRASYMGVRRGRVPAVKDHQRPYNVEQPQGVEADRDTRHVAAVMAEGGFPAAHVIDGKTVWVRPTERQAA